MNMLYQESTLKMALHCLVEVAYHPRIFLMFLCKVFHDIEESVSQNLTILYMFFIHEHRISSASN